MKTHLHILLVDDSEQMRELVTILPGQEHAHVTAVSDGQQAVERLRHARHPFDLGLSDVEMPHVDGWGLLAWGAEARRRATRGAHVGRPAGTLRPGSPNRRCLRGDPEAISPAVAA